MVQNDGTVQSTPSCLSCCGRSNETDKLNVFSSLSSSAPTVGPYLSKPVATPHVSYIARLAVPIRVILHPVPYLRRRQTDFGWRSNCFHWFRQTIKLLSWFSIHVKIVILCSFSFVFFKKLENKNQICQFFLNSFNFLIRRSLPILPKSLASGGFKTFNSTLFPNIKLLIRTITSIIIQRIGQWEMIHKVS